MTFAIFFPSPRARSGPKLALRGQLLLRQSVIIVFTASPLTHALAQQFEGQGFTVGESRVIPEVRLDYVSVDNAFRTSDNEVEASGLVVSPSASWEADRRLLELSASYRGRFGAFSESELDFTDHDVRARIQAAPGLRHRTSAQFRLLQEAEEIGTGQSRFTETTNDQIVETTTSLSAAYAYGAVGARGNVGIGFDINNSSFSNLGQLTDGDDNTSVGPSVFFSYRLSPDTRVRLEAQWRQLDFDEDSRDRNNLGLFAGLALAATDRTGGRIRLGVVESDFDSVNVENRTTAVIDVNAYFRPSSINGFNVIVNRDLQTVDNDPTSVGESIATNFELAWRYAWTPRFSTRIVFETDVNDRACPNIDTTTNGAYIEFDVGFRRWLSAGIGVGTESQSTGACEGIVDDGTLDYDRSTIGIHLTATL